MKLNEYSDDAILEEVKRRRFKIKVDFIPHNEFYYNTRIRSITIGNMLIETGF